MSLVDSAIAVAGEAGFAQTSARAVAKHAGVAPGVIYYHFGSMDGLFVAAHDHLTTERLSRIRGALEDATAADWVDRLVAAMSAELQHPSGAAAIELTVGAKTSPALTEAALRNTDRSVATVTELAVQVLGSSPVASIVSATAIAELAAAAFFGVEVMSQLGRTIDIEAIARPLSALLNAFG